MTPPFFTSDAALLLTMGPSQQSILLDRQALTDMLKPLGVEHIRVDPRPFSDLADRDRESLARRRPILVRPGRAA